MHCKPSFAVRIAALATLLLVPMAAFAQTYPNKPVRLIVPFAPAVVAIGAAEVVIAPVLFTTTFEPPAVPFCAMPVIPSVAAAFCRFTAPPVAFVALKLPTMFAFVSV